MMNNVKSVDNAIKGLTKYIDTLRSLATHNKEVADKVDSKIAGLQVTRNEADGEANKAVVLADKLEKLFSLE